MKQFFKSFIFFFLIAFVSCTGSRISEEKSDLPYNEHEMPLTVNEFINTPFTLSLISKGKWTVDTTFLKNPHNKAKTDTSLFYRYKESFIILLNGNFIEGSISNPEVKLINDIHIGMTKDRFYRKFKDLRNHTDQPYIEIQDDKIMFGCCSEGNELWEFEFENESLVFIAYSNLLD